MKVALFGGSFNPVHNGHLGMINEMTNYYEEVWVVPCGNHAFEKKLVSGEDRIKMLKLAIKKPNVKILDLQIKTPEKSYTYDLILELKNKYPKEKFSIVIGSDNLIDLKKWYKFDLLKKIVDFEVIGRPGYGVENRTDIKIKKIFEFQNDISSTDIRDRLKKGLSVDNLIPKKVKEFIKDRRLYIK